MLGEAREIRVEGGSAWLWPAHAGKKKKSWDVPTGPDKASEACAHLQQLAQASSAGHRLIFFITLSARCCCCVRMKLELLVLDLYQRLVRKVPGHIGDKKI